MAWQQLPASKPESGQARVALVLAFWLTTILPLLAPVVWLVGEGRISEPVGVLLFLLMLSGSFTAVLAVVYRRHLRRLPHSDLLSTRKLRLPGGRRRLVGRVRSKQPKVRSYLTGEPCVAASLQLGTLDGAVYLRGARAAELVLEQEDGCEVVVRGPVWVQHPSAPRSGRQMVPDLVDELRLDPTLKKLPAVVEEHVLRDGDWVEILGELGFEGAQDRAVGYRHGGLVRSLRGRPALVKVHATAREVASLRPALAPAAG